MAFKTIMVSLSSLEACRATLRMALTIARRWNSHIEVLHVKSDPRSLIPYTGDGMDGSMIEEIMETTARDSDERALKIKEIFDNMCLEEKNVLSDNPIKNSKMAISWRQETGREDEVVSLRGHFFDLIVLGQPIPDFSFSSAMTLDAALHDTGSTVLLAPSVKTKTVGVHPAIAWEASPETTKTITASMQVLKDAEKVTVLSPILYEPLALDPKDLLKRLNWHGIGADIHEFEANSSEIGKAFLTGAAEVGADLLIKGAYSQSRLRQIMLGGRTKYIVSNAEIPVILAK